MEPIGCMPVSLPSDRQWISSKQCVNRALPTSVDSSLSHASDIGSSSDIQSTVISDETHVRSSDMTTNMTCQMSTLHECSSRSSDRILPHSVDNIGSDADSTGVTEATVDHPANSLATLSKKQAEPDHRRSDVCADDIDGDIQPLGDSLVCNVCGDIAAGFHCGAYVCEACKVKIYI